jgi:hypothetical protein
MGGTVQVSLIKGEDVLGCISFKRFLVGQSFEFLVRFPTVVCFRPCRVPFIKDLHMWILCP